MKLVKSIVRSDGFTLFKRWRIVDLKWFTIDIHEFFLPEDSDGLKFDQDHFLHNHPRKFLSFIIKGGYNEDYKKDIGGETKTRKFKFGSFNWVNLKCFHRIKTLHSRHVKTLIITSTDMEEWGILDDSNSENPKVITNDYYRENKYRWIENKTG